VFEARSRIQFSISLFFTTTATLLTQNFGGTNQLNAIQRLAVVIFSMLVFTVFSTIIWNGLFNYKEGKAEMQNDWAFVTGRWKTSKVVMPAVTQKDMQLRQSTKRYPDAVDDSDQSNDDCSPVEAHDVTTEDAHGKEMGGKAADCAAMFSPEMRHEPKSFGERLRDDREFRWAWCRFCDRLCLLACFIVYLVTFVVICTMSSDQQLYGSLDILDIVDEINATAMANATKI